MTDSVHVPGPFWTVSRHYNFKASEPFQTTQWACGLNAMHYPAILRSMTAAFWEIGEVQFMELPFKPEQLGTMKVCHMCPNQLSCLSGPSREHVLDFKKWLLHNAKPTTP